MSTPPTLASFEALIDRHRASAPDANGMDIPERDPQARRDRAALHRVYERTTAAESLRDAGAFGPGEDLAAKLVQKWAQVDASDLRHVKGWEYREDAADHLNNNRAMSGRYDVTLQAEHRSTYAEASDYERRQAVLVAEKEDRKLREAEDMGLMGPGDRIPNEGLAEPFHPIARDARDSTRTTRGVDLMSEILETRTDNTATSVAASVREEDRARMEAYTSMKRQEALQKFPELQRAYDLQDASNAFRAQNSPDAGASSHFQKMTDEYIRQKLVRGEVLPEIKQKGQEQERDREKRQEQERTLESQRSKEAQIDR